MKKIPIAVAARYPITAVPIIAGHGSAPVLSKAHAARINAKMSSKWAGNEPGSFQTASTRAAFLEFSLANSTITNSVLAAADQHH